MFTQSELDSSFLGWLDRNVRGGVWEKLSTRYRDASYTLRDVLEMAFEDNDTTAIKVITKGEYRR